MNRSRNHRIALLLLSLFLASAPLFAGNPAERDGQRDFDFEVGAWNIHLKKLLHPLTGSSTWMEFDGTSMTRRILNGHASIEQFETDSSAGHIEGLTLRLYDPQTHEWRLYWANSADGELGNPMIGAFHDGVGEFYDQELYQGRAIYVRFLWSQITPNSAHFEQSFSADGGKTWEVNWITDQTRTGPEPGWNQEQFNRATAASAVPKADTTAPDDSQHAFDFDAGAWTIHMRRLHRPLTGSTEWTTLDGETAVHPLWGGRANLATVEADGPDGRLELLALRLYHPASQQWSISFATAEGGVLSVPCIGGFNNGRGDFYDQEAIAGRSVLVRFSIWPNGHDSVASEQAFSADGGKTWETNWVNAMARQHGAEKP